jgi:hypothetical protein
VQLSSVCFIKVNNITGYWWHLWYLILTSYFYHIVQCWGTLIPLWRQMYHVGVLGPFTSRVYFSYHFWTPICNVLGYWRHHSVCYFSYYDFTSRHYNLCLQCVATLWRCVSERFWFLFGSAAWISLLSLSPLCVYPFICCPWNRVFASGREDT